MPRISARIDQLEERLRNEPDSLLKETYRKIHEEPKRKDIPFRDLRSLMIAFGATIREGKGSRVSFLFGELLRSN